MRNITGWAAVWAYLPVDSGGYGGALKNISLGKAAAARSNYTDGKIDIDISLTQTPIAPEIRPFNFNVKLYIKL